MQLLSCDMWLMEPNAMRNFASLAAGNVTADLEQVREAAPKQRSMPAARQKVIGVVPVTGVLEARTTLIGELLGMSSYESVGQIFDHFMADDAVSGVILDVASPGGMVYGAQELADKIFSARGRGKPIVAVANPLMASGAYWIAAAADRIHITPSGDVGSIGVIAEHVDLSNANEKQGAKVTVIRSTGSPFKGEAGDAEPLTVEGRASLQARADAIHERFVADLAKFRGVSVEHVDEHFGKGRVVNAKAALAAGMVDRIDTLAGTGEKLASGRIRIVSERSQEYWPGQREALQARAVALRSLSENSQNST